MIKKYGALALILLVVLPGCWRKRTSSEKSYTQNDEPEVTVPVADNTIKSFFDEDVEEFVLMDDVEQKNDQITQNNNDQILDQHDKDFAWMEEVSTANDAFEVVHFKFAQHEAEDQEKEIIQRDIEHAKKLLVAGEKITIVIEGHACHSAGSHTYNLALSERRARTIADEFIAQGIPADYIKVVARGDLVPVIAADGKPVTGDREQQAPNRRGEVKVIYS